MAVGVERVLAVDVELEVIDPVAAPEQLPVADHRRHAEDAAADGVVRLAAQRRLRPRALRACEQGLAVHARGAHRGDELPGRPEVDAVGPPGAEDRLHDAPLLGARGLRQRHAQRGQRVERVEPGASELDAVERRVAQAVAVHPRAPRRHLGGAHGAPVVEQPREEHGMNAQLDAARGAHVLDAQPAEVRVRGNVVEVEVHGPSGHGLTPDTGGQRLSSGTRMGQPWRPVRSLYCWW